MAPVLDTKNLHAGDTVVFGYYGGEAIDWRVLEVRDEHVRLLSDKCLDWKPVNWDFSRGRPWSECDLKRWLDTDFLQTAFNPDEHEFVAGIDCLDRSDAYNYFANDAERMSLPTRYALEQGAYDSDLNGACCWWLKMEPDRPETPVFVYPDGDICMCAVCVDMPVCGVRPTVLIKRVG